MKTKTNYEHATPDLAAEDGRLVPGDGFAVGQPLSVHVRLEGNQIIVDRSEFPLSVYPALSNARLLRNVADMLELSEVDKNTQEGSLNYRAPMTQH